MKLMSDGEDAADARHDTPPKKRTISEYELEPILDSIAEAIDKGWFVAYGSAVSVLLYELRCRLNQESERAVSAERREPGLFPGLTYQDPAGQFECRPATDVWAEHAKNAGTLELRVLAAHLSTALDNVTAELKARQRP